MASDNKEFLHSLHPLLPEDLIAIQSDDYDYKQVPCCHLLIDKSDSKRMIKLNQTGVLIWGLCTEQRSLGEIVEILADAFEQDRAVVHEDVSRVMDHLLAENVVINSNNVELPE